MRKKIASLVMAAAMTLSVMSPFTGTAFAEEAAIQGTEVQMETVQATEETADVEPEKAGEEEVKAASPQQQKTDEEQESEAVQQAGALVEALPRADAVAGMSDEEKAAVSEQAAQALNAVDALSLEDYDVFMAKYGEAYDAVCNDLMAALMEDMGDTPTDMSLRPMEETKDAYLPLYGYSEEELQNFPVDDIPGLLVDKDGLSLKVADTYTSAWFYFVEDDVEEYHTIGNGETIDLWDYSSIALWESYPLRLVLGTGDQVDDENSHRYIVTVDLSTLSKLRINMPFDLDAADGGDIFFLPSWVDCDLFEQLGMPGRMFDCYFQGHADGAQYLLSIQDETNVENVERLRHLGIRTDVYPMSNFLAYRDQGMPLTGAITSQVITAEAGKGYLGNFDVDIAATNDQEAPNLFCFVFTDTATGEIIGYCGLGITMKSLSGRLSSTAYTYENGSMKAIGTSYESTPYVHYACSFEMGNTENVVSMDNSNMLWNQSWSLVCVLDPEYSVDNEYYITLDKIDEIQAVYAGKYYPEWTTQPDDVVDITEQVLRNEAPSISLGYKNVFHYIKEFTLVLKSGQIQYLHIGARNPWPWEGSTPTTPAPEEPASENEIDPDFEVSSIKLQGNTLDYYVAKAVGGIPLDTYYRNDERYEVGGYQLVMIKDRLTSDQMKQLVPSYLTPDGVVVSSGGRLQSGESDLSKVVWSDSLANTVMYQVQVPGKKIKNYQVTYATLQSGGTLYVAGPDERFVNLTGDNNYVHDILVANIGDTDLQGVTVELIDPVHVRLDEYWTLDGSTIPAFTQTEPIYSAQGASGDAAGVQSNIYANPNNITKVRLLADGEGEISGTLRITTADGQRRDIKLTGIAANPRIVSANLEDAVKFVPYSYMVVTDNMYRWNRTVFQLVEGTLPAGMYFYKNTGEIYGTPTETGDFTFTIRAVYSNSGFESSTATYTLHVADNTNQMVYEQTDPGYEIEVPLGVEQGEGTYDFVLTDISTNQLYVSAGEHSEFVGVWLNGVKLASGKDYTSESGSTRITISSQTLQDDVLKEGYNTIVAEFRVDGDRDNELKRTAQNFRLGEIQTSTSDDDQNNGSSGGGQNSGSSSGGQSSGSSGDVQTVTPEDSAAQAAADAAAAAATQAAKDVNLRFYIVDEADEPMAGVKVELHSTPRTGVTDSNGCVAFSGVEFGKHTLTVYGEDGEVLGSKSFELVSGAFGTNGDVITVMGGSTLSIRVKAANGVLSFVRVNLPQTGDESNLVSWIGVLGLVVCALAGVTVYRRKRIDRTSSQS